MNTREVFHAGAARLRDRWSLAIHGGAGVINRRRLSANQDIAYRRSLQQAIKVGEDVLKFGGPAVGAVEAVVRALENDPLFNAGRGSVFTADGTVELDAAIMDGKTLSAGAVAGVKTVTHPISLAKAVMEHSGHVMLAGEGADRFARSRRFERVDQRYFFTEKRWRSLKKFLADKGWPTPRRPSEVPEQSCGELIHDEGKWGTVGAVALDRQGNVAAATSTGGLTGKRFGRVGDSPLIGAGCYASNEACAVSCTGDGEFFIRLSVAHAIAQRVQLLGQSLQRAADIVIKGDLSRLEGQGGVIAVAPNGEIAWSFNTEGMYRAQASDRSKPKVCIYSDDE